MVQGLKYEGEAYGPKTKVHGQSQAMRNESEREDTMMVVPVRDELRRC